MIWLVCLTILCVSFITFLLWAPFRLLIDSKTDLYKLEWQPLVAASLVENNGRLGVLFQILFFKKIIPFESFFRKKAESKGQKASGERQKTKSKTPSVSWRRMRSKLRKILFSFDVKRCKVNWDTDDFILNAYLYPLTPFLYTPQKYFIINFQGKREIDLIIENRLWRILKSIF